MQGKLSLFLDIKACPINCYINYCLAHCFLISFLSFCVYICRSSRENAFFYKHKYQMTGGCGWRSYGDEGIIEKAKRRGKVIFQEKKMEKKYE